MTGDDGIATVSFTTAGSEVRVHALRTGTVTIKKCHHSGCLPERSPFAARFAAILLDRRFAAPMPVWTYAIEHPGGVFVIDTGAPADYDDDRSWERDPGGGRLVRSFIRLSVRDEETLPARLRAVGIDLSLVEAVVLTHQHIDHTGSVPAFPTAVIWTTKAEDAAARSNGAFPSRWRDDRTRVRHIDEAGGTAPGDPAGFGVGIDLVRDGSLRAFHTPGHTPGSVTVRLTTDQTEFWFTGDTSFTARGMDPSAPTAGIHSDVVAVRALQAELRSRSVLLPAHDPDVARRLRDTARGAARDRGCSAGVGSGSADAADRRRSRRPVPSSSSSGGVGGRA